MSPLTVRRYRAERLMRREFDALRASVTARVRARLRIDGIALDASDLEYCYAAAWQALYAVLLEGRDIDNPAGWLSTVAYRRAVDEHRARRSALQAQALRSRDGRDPLGAGLHETHAPADAVERDLAVELDERTRLRQLFEGLRVRLSAREREAATLCYLQGLSRAEAAERMGVSEKRMRKLMDGEGDGAQGVAGKMAALVAAIEDGRWCESQGSLMRALAYGILDPDGERYELALAHHHDCPACRAYVRSLRGLAVLLPPVLTPWGLGASVLARAGTHPTGGIGAGGGAGANAGAGSGMGSLTAAAGTSAGAGGAGGGWLLGGTVAGKLATGCLLALGVGASCVALSGGPPQRAHRPERAHRSAHVARAILHGAEAAEAVEPSASQPSIASSIVSAGAAASDSEGALTPARKASHEFGPERSLDARAAGAQSARAARRPDTAQAASAGRLRTPADGEGAQPDPGLTGGGASTGAATKAEREFAPG